PDWPWEVSTKRTLTKLDSNNNRRNVRNAIDGFAVGGGTPTASGLVRALNSYESAKGNTSGRQTIFVLITDGVANARHETRIGRTTYEGYIKMRDRWSLFYQFNEAKQEYQGALAEVEDKAQDIKNKGYTLIVGFWENYDRQITQYTYNGQNRYDGDRLEGGYYPVRPKVIESLQRTASDPDSFFAVSTKDGDNINDFVAKLTQHIEAHIGVTATFNVTEHYNIDPNSVKVLRDGSTYNGATVETNNGQITVTLPDEAPA